eukprot:gene17678-23268_t
MQRNNNNTITAKPEYVLKRANDLINTAYGNNADREKKLALDQLHNVISNKRKGNWTKIHEDLMKRHIELCVDLKDHRLVKDGLHQYRNLCQNIEPISLEIVINHLIDLSEKRATEARNKADKVTLAAAAKVADLDQEESPESILLSSMTDEGSKHRTDIEVVVPWLKFLWEIYQRKGRIDDLKQAIELSQQRKEEIDRIKREEVERQRLDNAKKQFLIDRDIREKQRQQQELLRIECEGLLKEFEKYNYPVELEELMKLDAITRKNLLLQAKNNFIKFKEEQQKKLHDQAKKLDYYVRAQRLESVKIVEKIHEDNYSIDIDIHNKKVEKITENAQIEHENNMNEKLRLKKFEPFRKKFETKFIDAQKQLYEESTKNFIQTEKEKRLFEKVKKARDLLQKEYERERLEEEAERLRIAKEESDRIAKEQDEKLRKLRAEDEQLQREKEFEEEKRRDKRVTPSDNEPSNWRAKTTPLSPAPVVSNNDADNNQWRRVTSNTGKSEPEGTTEQPQPSSTSAPYRPPRSSDKSLGAFADRPSTFGNSKFNSNPPVGDNSNKYNSFPRDSGKNGPIRSENENRNSGRPNGGFSDRNFSSKGDGEKSGDTGRPTGGFGERNFSSRDGEKSGDTGRQGGGFGDRNFSSRDVEKSGDTFRQSGGFGDRNFNTKVDSEKVGDKFERSFGKSDGGFGSKPSDSEKWGSKRSSDNNRRDPPPYSRKETKDASSAAESTDSWRKK